MQNASEHAQTVDRHQANINASASVVVRSGAHFEVFPLDDRFVLQLFFDGVPSGGGVFPFEPGDEESKTDAWNDAFETGQDWMQ